LKNWAQYAVYFSRQEAQFDRFTTSVKFVTAEREAIPNAARKYTAAVVIPLPQHSCRG